MSERKKRKVLETAVGKTYTSSIDMSYESGLLYEEEEASNRTPNHDVNLFKKQFSNLKNIFDFVLDLKKKNCEKLDRDVAEKQRQASLIFVMLKKINRLEKYQIRAGRDALQKEKIRVDSNRLQLQNLLYEVSHLKREIHRCYQFKSQDEDIDLVPEDEFYEKAPESISRPEITKETEHTKRLARLDWELHQRKELSALCKELLVLKEKATKEIALQIERLNSFGPCLKSLLKATRPLQVALEMPIEKSWEMNSIVKLLPQPLYLVYINVHSYGESCDPDLKITVEGSEEDVRLYDASIRDDFVEDGAASDTDEVDVKKRKTYLKKSDLIEQRRKKFLDPHPMFVTVSMGSSSNSKGNISVSLRYFPLFGFVSASSTIQVESVELPSGDIVSPENILNYLYENDEGENSPTPKTAYQLQQLDLSEPACLAYIRNKGFGRPYKWAQKMCGVEFNNSEDNNAVVSLEISVPEIIKRIKLRWNSRLNLLKQISALENKNIELYFKDESISQVKLSSSLVQWTSLSWEDYAQNIATKRFIDEELVQPSYLFYRAVATRGSAKLECFISISFNFPADCPIWALSVSWNGQHNALNNSAIKDMEFWTNSLTQAQIKHKFALLSSQLARTMCSFDIFLETESPQHSPSEFTQEKNFLKSFSKRIRGRPFRYTENGSVKIFKQL